MTLTRLHPTQRRHIAARHVSRRLIAQFRAGKLTRSQALVECSKVIEPAVGETAWKLFVKGIK